MTRFSKAILLGLIMGLLGIMASFSPYGVELEEGVGLSLLFKLRGERAPPQEVVIIALDKQSADDLNLPHDTAKWPRSYHARLIQKLHNQGASVIAFDLLFKEETSDDELLAQAIRKAGNVVLVEALEKETIPLKDPSGQMTGTITIEKRIPPVPALAQESAGLATFPLPKVPVRVSQFWAFKDGAVESPTVPVVALQLFTLQVFDDVVRLLKKVISDLNHTQASREQINESSLVVAQRVTSLKKKEMIVHKKVDALIRDLRMILGGQTIISSSVMKELERSADAYPQALIALMTMYQTGNSHYLNFYGPPRTITTVPYSQAFQLPSRVVVNQEEVNFSGKVVFIGLSEMIPSRQKDGFYTVYSQANGLDLNGVEICATAFGNLLEDLPVRPLDVPCQITFIVIWGLAVGMIWLLLSPVIAIVSSGGLILLLLSTASYQFTTAALWLPVIIPLVFQMPVASFGAVLWNYFEVNQERRRILKTLGYYVPDRVVNQLPKNLQDLKSYRESVYGTCLCTDIENYMTLSESMSPESLKILMNEYYETIFTQVNQYEGIVQDVRGDSMLAVWTEPEPDSTIRTQACLAALAMTHAVDRFNHSSGYPKLHTRIGLHAGRMVIGNVGGSHKVEYRAVGDIVNTASRIEGLNKHMGTRLLASQEVVCGQEDFLTRELGAFLLAGKMKPIVVHEIVTRVRECNEDQQSLCAEFSDALTFYRTQQWSEGVEQFTRILREHTTDGPSLFYRDLCKPFKDHPPPEPWDGVVRLDKK